MWRSNLQLYLSIGIPTFTVILALLISLFQNNRLSDKMDRQFEKLADRMDRLAEQHHKDILMLMSEIVRLNDRVAKMER